MVRDSRRAVSAMAGRVVDPLLEATVVGSFSRVGYRLRRRLLGWDEPAASSMVGQVAVVTGATGGLGGAISVGLAKLGATVWLLGRDRDRLDELAHDIRAEVPGAHVEIATVDLARLADVHAVADTVLAGSDRLDVLVHNAGVMMSTHELTADGLEMTTQVHVVAPFLLTSLLFERLRATPGSRVITVSSGGMYTKRLEVDALTPEPASFDGVAAYASTKRAQVVLTQEWASRTAGSGVTFYATHPGWVETPGLRASLPRFAGVMGPLLRSPQEGADTIVWLASAPAGEQTGAQGSGRFWHDRRPRSTVRLPWTRSPDGEAERLWRWTAEHAGTPDRVPK